MFDNYLIRIDSLRNEERNGEIVGFALAVRNANYRGVFLSLHNGYFLEVDGVVYPTAVQTFEINGRPPRSFDEIRTAVWEHWDYDDEGILHVHAPAGLAPGTHTVRFQQSVLAAYGYLPTDEEWVQQPPQPGTGAGSDKTPQIVTYELPLNGQQPAPEANPAIPQAIPQGHATERLTWDQIPVPQEPDRVPNVRPNSAGIKLGVSLYSYQQSRFFQELDLEAQIREVGENLAGADGIELVDEMSLRYPYPGDAFVYQWRGWMEHYGTVPVTMDVSMDVLQFRDHVMSIEECGARLRHDIRLAKALGFRNVRVLSTTPLDVMLAALPLAEQLDIRLGKEIHQPMPLEGRQVTEIIDFVGRTGTAHLGIVPDFGIFQIRPSEALLGWFERKGARAEATAASVELAALLERGWQANPAEWRLALDLGYVYWRQQRFAEARVIYERAARLPGAPAWLPVLAATVAARGNDVVTARAILQALYESSTDEYVRSLCLARLQALQMPNEQEGVNHGGHREHGESEPRLMK